MNPCAWTIRAATAADLEGIFLLLTQHGWAHRIPDREFLERLLLASQRALVAVADGQVLGFCRAITDGLSNGYLSMLVVAPEWRAQGIGRGLVEAITGADEDVTWMLRASRSQAPDFFAKLGFVPSCEAMERTRKRSE